MGNPSRLSISNRITFTQLSSNRFLILCIHLVCAFKFWIFFQAARRLKRAALLIFKQIAGNKRSIVAANRGAASATPDAAAAKSRQNQFDDICEEIESLLSKLSALNDEVTKSYFSNPVDTYTWVVIDVFWFIYRICTL